MNTLCFNAPVAHVATILDSTENSEISSGDSKGIDIRDIVYRMYDSDGYVCDDEE